MTDVNTLYGWELLYKTVERDIRNKEDILICFVHWALGRNSFRCIGTGEDKTFTGKEEKFETLPEGWNSADTYALRYNYNGLLVILKASLLEDELMINLLCMKLQKSTVTRIPLSTVGERGSMSKMIPEYSELITQIYRDLVEPIATDDTYRSTSTQTTSMDRGVGVTERLPRIPMGPLLGPTSLIGPGIPSGPGRMNLLEDVRNVGRADLDPFGRGGGMLMGIPHPSPAFPNMPFGRNPPPGARFDPFSPAPNPDLIDPTRRNPDNDDLPPPGFNDMFM